VKLQNLKNFVHIQQIAPSIPPSKTVAAFAEFAAFVTEGNPLGQLLAVRSRAAAVQNTL